MHLLAWLLTAALAVAEVQTRRVEPADVRCPSVLGVGVTTDRTFCDVLTGQDPAQGVIVRIPPHRGDAT